MGSITWDEPEQLPAGGNITWDSDQPKQQTYDDPIPSIPWGDLAAGAVRGAGSIGATILAPWDIGKDFAAGKGLSLESNRQRRADMDSGLQAMGADPTSNAYAVGKFGGEVAGTMGAGGALAQLLMKYGKIGGAIPSALESWGMTTKAPGFVGPSAPMTGIQRGVDAATRFGAGAATGGISALAVDPESTAMGAGIGAAVPFVAPPVSRGVAYIGGKAYDAATGQLANVRGANLLRGAAGEDRATISQLWQNADPSLTAAQAAADAGRYEMSALGKVAQMHNPSYYGNKGDAQVAANLGRIERAGGSDSAAAALEARKVGGKAVETALGPEREMLLDIANVGAEAPRMLKEADTLRQLAIKMFGKGNQQAAAQANARATVLEQRAADVQKKYNPLDVSNASDEIHRMIDDPKLGSSENVKSVLLDVNNQIQQWVNKGEGVIDAHALYGKRKTAIGETVDRLLAGNPQASKELSAKLATRVKAEIDASLNAVTGGQWSPFLTKYSGQLGELGQNELMGVARKMYAAGDHVGFMNLIKNESPETVRKIMTTTDNINTALPTVGLMGPSNKLATLQNVGADITRNEQLGKQATEGADALYRIVANQNMKFKIPGMISRTATIGNAALATIESRLNAKTMDIVTEAMKNGQSANELMALLPAHERNAALMWIANGGPANHIARTTGAIAGNSNQ
jgi:hypothetical protein